MKKLITLIKIVLSILLCIIGISECYSQIPMMVKDANPSNANGVPFGTTAMELNNVLLYIGNDGTSGLELWSSDGSLTGTNMIKDINPGPTGSVNGIFFKWNNEVYFNADNGTEGREIWKTNGTLAGTQMLADIWSGITSANASQFTDGNNGTFYFVANDGIHGEELWKSDGSLAGTSMVKDIFSGTGASSAQLQTVINGILYFIANDGITGYELWRSDGTDWYNARHRYKYRNWKCCSQFFGSK